MPQSSSLVSFAICLLVAATTGFFAVRILTQGVALPFGALALGAFSVVFLGFAGKAWGKYRKPPLLLEATSKGILTLQPSRGNKYPNGVFIPWREVERISCEDVALPLTDASSAGASLPCVTLHLLPGHRVPVEDLPLRGANIVTLQSSAHEMSNTLHLDVHSNFGTPKELADALERLRQTV